MDNVFTDNFAENSVWLLRFCIIGSQKPECHVQKIMHVHCTSLGLRVS